MTAAADAPHIGLVVEGPGDRNALPVLLRMHLGATGRYGDILGKPVVCNGRDKALTEKGIEGFTATAASRPGCVAVLIVLDGEGDAVCALGPTLANRAQSVTQVPVVVCLAEEMFEDWLYASIETLGLGIDVFDAQVRGLTAICDALRPTKYVKPTWQPRLTARIDLSVAARRSRSLSRLFERFDVLATLVAS